MKWNSKWAVRRKWCRAKCVKTRNIDAECWDSSWTSRRAMKTALELVVLLNDHWLEIEVFEIEAFFPRSLSAMFNKTIPPDSYQYRSIDDVSELSRDDSPLASNSNLFLRYIIERRWYSGEHSCLPSSWPGFDSRPTQRFFSSIFCILPDLFVK